MVGKGTYAAAFGFVSSGTPTLTLDAYIGGDPNDVGKPWRADAGVTPQAQWVGEVELLPGSRVASERVGQYRHYLVRLEIPYLFIVLVGLGVMLVPPLVASRRVNGFPVGAAVGPSCDGRTHPDGGLEVRQRTGPSDEPVE